MQKQEPPIIIDHGEAAQARERVRQIREVSTLPAVIAANIQRRAAEFDPPLKRLNIAQRANPPITWNNIDNVWQGKVQATLTTLERIARVLKCTVPDLLKAQ